MFITVFPYRVKVASSAEIFMDLRLIGDWQFPSDPRMSHSISLEVTFNFSVKLRNPTGEAWLTDTVVQSLSPSSIRNAIMRHSGSPWTVSLTMHHRLHYLMEHVLCLLISIPNPLSQSTLNLSIFVKGSPFSLVLVAQHYHRFTRLHFISALFSISPFYHPNKKWT